MALSEDQKAMLKLVSQPDTSYEDIAALMGLSVEQVRAKVDDALKQLDGGAATPAEPEPEEKPKAEKKPEPESEPKAAPKQAPESRKPAPATKVAGRGSRPSLGLPEDRGARYG